MTAPSRRRPSWQAEPCPAWCVVEHEEDDPPADRIHDSAGRYVPITRGEPIGQDAAASAVLLVMSRRCGDFQDWVFVGEPDHRERRLTMTRESAAHLAHELLRLVASHDQRPDATDESVD